MKNQIIIGLLILQGFTYKTAKQYIRLKKKYDRTSVGKYSFKQIMSVMPFGKCDKIFEDALSTQRALYKYRANMPVFYGIRLKRDNDLIYCPLEDERVLDSNEIITLLRSGKSLDIRKSAVSIAPEIFSCGYSGGMFFINGEAAAEDELKKKLDEIPADHLVCEHVEEPFCEITTINETGSAPYIAWKSGDADLSIEKLVLDIAGDFPEVEYMHFTAGRREDKTPVIVDVNTGMDLFCRDDIDAQTARFLDMKLDNFRKNRENIFKIARRYIYSYFAQKKDFVDYMYTNWRRGKKEDKKTCNVSRSQMRWAHRRGFYSYRIQQYGLTEENYGQFLSDYEYKRLRPINNEYRKWLQDKLSFYYILRRFGKYLPDYYYHIVLRNNRTDYLRLDMCPAELDDSAEGVMSLIRLKRKLAFKPVVSSHGEGFYKVEYREDGFYINDSAVKEEELHAMISGFEKDYLITEYIEMHPLLKEIYPNAACTIRIMAINRDCASPKIMDAYFRIATSSTGPTDNLGSGGIFAHINVDTGEFTEGYSIKDHKIVSCNTHPDTGTPIRARIPQWDEIREAVLDVCHFVSPLEYLGFDIVATQKSAKILEINTHQDLHRYPNYSHEIKEFFRFKKSLKK